MIGNGPSVMHLADFVNGTAYKPEDFGDHGIPVVRIKHLLDESADLDLAPVPPRPVWLQDDDLVFSWSATLAVRLWNRGKALLNQHLFRVDVRPGVDRRWFAYVLEEGTRRLEPLMHGSAMTHITLDMLKSLTIAQPPLATQRAIADYLGRETARIDALIAAKQRLAGLLEERDRESLSLIISRIDGHRRPLRWFAVVGSGDGISQSDIDAEGETPVYGGNGIMGYTALAPMTRAPSIAIGRVGALCGNVHVVPRAAWITDNALWLRDLRGLDIDYVALVLRAARLNDLADKTAQPLITGETVKNTRVPFPPLATQREIQQRAAKSALHTSALTRRLGDHITLLRERRQALITAAVTGQLDIPEAA